MSRKPNKTNRHRIDHVDSSVYTTFLNGIAMCNSLTTQQLQLLDPKQCLDLTAEQRIAKLRALIVPAAKVKMWSQMMIDKGDIAIDRPDTAVQAEINKLRHMMTTLRSTADTALISFTDAKKQVLEQEAVHDGRVTGKAEDVGVSVPKKKVRKRKVKRGAVNVDE